MALIITHLNPNVSRINLKFLVHLLDNVLSLQLKQRKIDPNKNNKRKRIGSFEIVLFSLKNINSRRQV